MVRKGVFARVVIAAVLASGLRLGHAARAEEKRTTPTAKSGKVIGILTAKTDTEITVKPEGKPEEQTFLLAPPGGTPSASVQAAAKTLFIPNLVALRWQRQQDQPVVTRLQAIMPKVRTGTVIGTIVGQESTDKSIYIDVKPAGGRGFTERYWPRFVSNSAPNLGGFDQSMIETIGRLNVGDKVKLTWACDERKRAAKVQIIARARERRAARKGSPQAESVEKGGRGARSSLARKASRSCHPLEGKRFPLQTSPTSLGIFEIPRL